MSEKISGLQEYLSQHPEITEVWFDDKDQWCFAPCTLYPIHKSIEEVMQMGKASKKSEPTSEETTKANAKK